MEHRTIAKRVCNKIESILDHNYTPQDCEEIETMINVYVQRLKRERRKNGFVFYPRGDCLMLKEVKDSILSPFYNRVYDALNFVVACEVKVAAVRAKYESHQKLEIPPALLKASEILHIILSYKTDLPLEEHGEYITAQGKLVEARKILIRETKRLEQTLDLLKKAP